MSTKRTITGDAVGTGGTKFQLEQTDNSFLYAVVSPFNGTTYVHLRKYYNDLPSKLGVCFPVKEWYDFVKFVIDSSSETQFSTPTIACRKSKNGSINLSCEKKDVSIYIKKTAIDSLVLR